MKGTTQKKGRPTPPAPQNRPSPIVKAADTTQPLLTPEQEARLIERERYRAYRLATRPLRRMLGGIIIDQRLVWRHAAGAQALLVRDGQRVRDYVREQLGGVEDVAKIAQGVSMKRGRVRMILAQGLAR